MTKPQAAEQSWSLFSEDWVPVVGQFPAEDFSLRVGSAYGEITTNALSHPILQFLQGQAETISFRGLFRAQHADDDIRPQWRNLLRLVRPSDELGRPPVCDFALGAVYNAAVVVEEVSGVSFELRPDGSPLEIRFSLALRTYRPSSTEPTDPSRPETSTIFHEVRQGDTYERIAALYYGGPAGAIHGEWLRRMHPRRVDVVVGETVEVPLLAAVLALGRIRLQAIPFLQTDVAQNRLAELFDSRASSLVVPR